jgi:hypothetical protein
MTGPDWFASLAAANSLNAAAAHELEERGFVVIPGPVPVDELASFTHAYDTVVASTTGADIKHGTTSIRVNDFVNRGPAFDPLYVFPPLLEASYRVIGQPFKLSSMHARSLRPGAHHQGLHVDVRRDSADWPLAGFILMVDAFEPDNGATAFVPGSHRWSTPADDLDLDPRASLEHQVLACGVAGSLLVFNGSTWHGHSPNTTSRPRRSIQGAFIPRSGRAGTDFAARMQPETRARLSPMARSILAL